ncbi:unnamed protein product [Oikopleura dioica]|uniref:Probable arginine--tRNA ligase, mitochondrial n=1 Tax=Oikopleura dioica TaxID=34765 RepID=E4X8N4_OIKDI|nr:unnamed protein product [Oikopleura dioica]
MSEVNYRKQYELFGVNFHHWERESDVSDASSILKLLQNAGNNFAKDEDVQLELKKFNPSWALGKNKNSRKKASKVQFHQLYSADSLCYITDISQKDHFHKLCSALDYFGYTDIAAKIEFVGFGKLEGMSTRAGTGLSLESVIDEAVELQAEMMEKHGKTTYARHNFDQLDGITKKKHAAWFVAASVFSSKRQKDLKFNWQLHLKNDNGMYLQRIYSKIKNLLSKVESSRLEESVDDADFSSFIYESHWNELLQQSAAYSKARQKAIDELDGFILLQFGLRLGQLAHKVIFKDEKWILIEDRKSLHERIMLFDCVLMIVEDLLKLLGYQPSDQF